MLKIVLHCDSGSRNLIEPALSQYFEQKMIQFELRYVGSSAKFISNYFFNKEFKLLIIYKSHQLSYIMKTYNNFAKNYMHMVSGSLELPLNFEEIENKLFKNIENTFRCPYGVYNINSSTVFRKILHEDIEYIHRLKRHSIIHLRNGETERVTTSIIKIQKELNEKYFVKCAKGYLVNIFNVKKAHKNSNIIELKSGKEIPLTRTSFREFLNSYIEVMSGYTISME